MTRRAGWIGLGLLVSAAAAHADEAETLAMRRVRLTTDGALARGCARLGAVRDDSIKDLRRKIVRLGGDTAVLAFGLSDLEMVHADVYRCPPASPLPADIPPPPPGTPPPPPPGPTR